MAILPGYLGDFFLPAEDREIILKLEGQSVRWRIMSPTEESIEEQTDKTKHALWERNSGPYLRVSHSPPKPM